MRDETTNPVEGRGLLLKPETSAPFDFSSLICPSVPNSSSKLGPEGSRAGPPEDKREEQKPGVGGETEREEKIQAQPKVRDLELSRVSAPQS